MYERIAAAAAVIVILLGNGKRRQRFLCLIRRRKLSLGKSHWAQDKNENAKDKCSSGHHFTGVGGGAVDAIPSSL
jgi:hypothetical protein